AITEIKAEENRCNAHSHRISEATEDSEMLSWKEGTEIDTEKAEHSQEVLDEIKIGSLSKDLIKNQVKEKERQEDLITITRELQDMKRISFYTDGSLYETEGADSIQRPQMGAG
ncbi:10612_t:CDS:2, partial [Ambispora leptoticha]